MQTTLWEAFFVVQEESRIRPATRNWFAADVPKRVRLN